MILDDLLKEKFGLYLKEKEYSKATVKKYLHDISLLMIYAAGENIDKQTLMGFKKYLEENNYTASSINSMLGAVNCLLHFCGNDEWKLGYLKVQRKFFVSEKNNVTRGEYRRMVRMAKRKGNKRLAMIITALTSLGIRVSELKYITVESVYCGMAVVKNKGKERVIIYPQKFTYLLKRYIVEKKIETGSVFVTRSKKPIDRSAVWKMLKKLAADAGVDEKKVFPHALRHLFAREWYGRFNDVVKLADILGHSSIETTRIYTKDTGEEERRKMDMMRMVM